MEKVSKIIEEEEGEYKDNEEADGNKAEEVKEYSDEKSESYYIEEIIKNHFVTKQTYEKIIEDLASKSGRVYVCDERTRCGCKKEFGVKKEFIRHSIPAYFKFHCIHCNTTCTRLDNLQKHLQKYH